MRKKIRILILLLVLTIVGINRVKAESFYEDNYINGVYANLIDGDFRKPQQMRFIRRKSDNKPSYCLTPRVFLYDTENYQSYSFGNSTLNFSLSKLNRINQIAYFGYGYPGHTENYWYAITQIMIWKEVEPNMDIFFTDTKNGNRINRYENEINEINSLINNYNKLPRLSPDNLIADKEYIITDNANVLKDFELTNYNGMNVSKEGNSLKVTTYNIGDYSITLQKNQSIYTNTPYVYKASRGQDILVQGKINGLSLTKYFKVLNQKLQIIKQDSETDEYLEGAEYKLYDKYNELVGECITNYEGICEIDHLINGEYILEEVNAPEGYELDNDRHLIYISSYKDLTQYELKNKKIKAKLIINKALKDDYNKKESGIKFNIYDLNDNLIDTLETDNDGCASTILEYGKYKIVQLNTTEGYKKVEDFYVDVKNSEDIIYNLEDELIVEDKIINNESVVNRNEIKTFNNRFDNNTNDILNDKVKIDYQNNENKTKDTSYPITSDKDMYIYIIIGYLAFIGLLYLIASIKNEK